MKIFRVFDSQKYRNSNAEISKSMTGNYAEKISMVNADEGKRIAFTKVFQET
jgi:hypothetical protein